ncbi:MAG: hypothetical protein RL541_1619, partial [Pseudomonadota bacterium]
MSPQLTNRVGDLYEDNDYETRHFLGFS